MRSKRKNDPFEEALGFLGWREDGEVLQGGDSPSRPVEAPPVTVRALAILLSLLARLTRKRTPGAAGRSEDVSPARDEDRHPSTETEWTDSRIVSLCLSAPESSRPEVVGLLPALVAHRRPGTPWEESSWISLEAPPTFPEGRPGTVGVAAPESRSSCARPVTKACASDL